MQSRNAFTQWIHALASCHWITIVSYLHSKPNTHLVKYNITALYTESWLSLLWGFIRSGQTTPHSFSYNGVLQSSVIKTRVTQQHCVDRLYDSTSHCIVFLPPTLICRSSYIWCICFSITLSCITLQKTQPHVCYRLVVCHLLKLCWAYCAWKCHICQVCVDGMTWLWNDRSLILVKYSNALAVCLKDVAFV